MKVTFYSKMREKQTKNCVLKQKHMNYGFKIYYHEPKSHLKNWK